MPDGLRQLGPYDLLDPLGAGGMGTVYRARHRQLGAERAVKVINRPNPQRIQRFRRELESLAQVRHPGVVRVHEVGGEGDSLYFAMELVEGQPLDAALAERLPLKRALRICVALSEAAGALHKAGIVHRDLKPANVILSRSGRPVLLDLGLAYLLEPDRDRLTREGAIVGTLQYMAPEQLTGKHPVTPATDVYALGLLLHELACGEPAIGGVTAAEALVQVAQGPPRRPSQVDPRLPAAIDDVVARACHLDPAQRYSDGDAMAQALLAVERGTHGSFRRRAMLGALALAVVAGASFAGWGRRSIQLPVASPATRPSAAPSTGVVKDVSVPRFRRGDPERLRQARDWLAQYPDDPRAADVRRRYYEEARTRPLRSFKMPQAFTRSLYLSHGRVVCSGRRGGGIWDGDPFDQIVEFETSAAHAAVSRDRRRFVVAQDLDTVATVYDARGTALAQLPIRAGWGRGSAFSPDGSLLALGGSSGPVQLVSVETGQIVASLGDHANTVMVLTWLDPDLVVTGAGWSSSGSARGPNKLRVWRLSTGALEGEYTLPFMPHSLATDGNGAFACGIENGYLLLARPGERWQMLAARVQPERAFDWGDDALAHSSAVHGVAFTPNGELLISVSGGAFGADLAVWDVESGSERLRLFELEAPGSWNGIDVSPDGERILLTGRDVVEEWSLPALLSQDPGRE